GAAGDLATSVRLSEEAVTLKERALGPDHPDVAITLSNLALERMRLGQLDAALTAIDRALSIHTKSGDPDASVFANLHSNRGDVLVALQRYAEAGDEFAASLKVLRRELASDHENLSQALHGIGQVRLAQGAAAEAIPYLEESLSIRDDNEAERGLT